MEKIKDLQYYKENAEENYLTTPISVLRYITELEQALQLQQTDVSGSDVFQAVDEAMSLIDYMHQLTVIPDNMVEDYANRFANIRL